MDAERKKPGAIFWCAVALAVVLAFPASFGPACWASAHSERGVEFVAWIYGPFIRLFWFGEGRTNLIPLSVQEAVFPYLVGYARLGAPEEWAWAGLYPIDQNQIEFQWVCPAMFGE